VVTAWVQLVFGSPHLGVRDDGIDTLEPQLEPICEWIDKARAEGGQVLVHCRVGVSRSATVTVSGVFGFFYVGGWVDGFCDGG
jgi:protein-tyrosine phosphatase